MSSNEEEIMPRIPGVPTKDAGPLLRAMYRFARRRYGAVPEPMTVSAHHLRLMIAGGRHELAVQKASKALPANVRDIAVYRVAQRLGCSWCVDFGTMLLRLQGLDIERLKQIDDYATSPAYDARERLAIAYADAMSTSPVTVTDEQVAELRAEFGDKAVVELTYHIALENMRARFNSALDITDQGFASGDACRVPVPADTAASTASA
jgi:AhpD family alkylhydroperoxidase